MRSTTGEKTYWINDVFCARFLLCQTDADTNRGTDVWPSEANLRDLGIKLEFRKKLRKAIVEKHVVFETVDLHKAIFDTCCRLGVEFAALPASDPELPMVHPCNLCDRTFSSAQVLQGHQWKRHGVFSMERRFIYSTTCLACHRCFWTT